MLLFTEWNFVTSEIQLERAMPWERMFWKQEGSYSEEAAQNKKWLDFLFCFSPIKPPTWHFPRQGDKEQKERLEAKKAASNFATIVFENESFCWNGCQADLWF